MFKKSACFFAVFLTMLGVNSGFGASSGIPASGISALPRPDHVVVVVEENHAYEQIIGNKKAAGFTNALAKEGALFTQYHATVHPSQPNYLVLFSGSTQGVTDDGIPAAGSPFMTSNLAFQLKAKGLTFAGYAEDLPFPGFLGDAAGAYVRKHAPWTNWDDTSVLGLPFSKFPADYSKLPTVAFVIPGLQEDMHDGTVSEGDAWLKKNLSGYIQWAKTHNSLFILTYDEDNRWHGNHIPTVFVGPMVKPGRYREPVDHYNLFETLAELYGLPGIDRGKNINGIVDVWKFSDEVKKNPN